MNRIAQPWQPGEQTNHSQRQQSINGSVPPTTPTLPITATRHTQSLTSKIPPQVFILFSIFSTQIGASLGKNLFPAIGPLGTTFLRQGFAALLLLIIWRPDIRKLNRRTILIILGFGATTALMNGAYYASIGRIPMGIAVALEFVGPLGVSLVQSRKPADVLWAVLAGVGILLLAPLGKTGVDPLGVILALLAGVGWGGYILLNVQLGRAFSGGQGLALSLLAAAIIMSPFGISSGGTTLLQPGILVAGLGVAVLSTLIPFSLEIEALRRLPSRVFGILMSVEPAVAALIGFLILGEVLALQSILAIALIILASAGVSLTTRSQSGV